VRASFEAIKGHSINATDAIVLHSALDLAARLRVGQHDLVLVASDARLLRSARAEGLIVFNPEADTLDELSAMCD